MIEIDGSRGEGGGQILRSSLALSLITGQPVHLKKIRAGRGKPGLMRQHLTCVRAAAEVGAARVEGDALRSQELTFHPRGLRAGEYRFSVGTAGSATLVFQTILPALLRADGPSRVTLEGGTHNGMSPPFEFLDEVFAPRLREMGVELALTLDRPGFYPAGGGRFTAHVTPCPRLAPIEILDRGGPSTVRARALISRLHANVGHRELKVLRDRLGLEREAMELVEERRSPGPGNVVSVIVDAPRLREIATAFGRRGLPAEDVAGAAADETERLLAGPAPVGQHLADQLLLPMAMAGRGRFRTLRPSPHTTTNIDTIRRFLDVPIAVTELADDLVEIALG